MFKAYFDYLKDNPSDYWFKRKWFGWGWTPANWKGWLLTLIFIILLMATGIAMENRIVTETFGFTTFVVMTLVFIAIAYKKGEAPGWMWGNPKKKSQK